VFLEMLLGFQRGRLIFFMLPL